MKYLELYIFPLLTAAYGAYLLYFLPRNGGYFGDIAGMIMLLLSGGGVIIASILWLVTKRLQLPDKTYVRILLGLLGMVLAYVVLWLYVQMQ